MSITRYQPDGGTYNHPELCHMEEWENGDYVNFDDTESYIGHIRDDALNALCELSRFVSDDRKEHVEKVATLIRSISLEDDRTRSYEVEFFMVEYMKKIG